MHQYIFTANYLVGEEMQCSQKVTSTNHLVGNRLTTEQSKEYKVIHRKENKSTKLKPGLLDTTTQKHNKTVIVILTKYCAVSYTHLTLPTNREV